MKQISEGLKGEVERLREELKGKERRLEIESLEVAAMRETVDRL